MYHNHGVIAEAGLPTFAVRALTDMNFPRVPGQAVKVSRYRIGRLEDRVDWSNYDYSKLKKKEGKESYSTRCS